MTASTSRRGGSPAAGASIGPLVLQPSLPPTPEPIPASPPACLPETCAPLHTLSRPAPTRSQAPSWPVVRQKVSIGLCTSATQRRRSATTSGCLHSASTCQLVSSHGQPSLHCLVSSASRSPRLAFTVIVASHPNSILFTTVADAASLNGANLPAHLSGESIWTVASL